jgi:outer membrane protein OmpA-like peptidoglycan-associated protein
MKSTRLILVVAAIILSTNIFAQRTTDVEGSSDYRGLTRLDGSFIEFYRSTKWDVYKIPIDFENKTLDWIAPAVLEGPITRIQYSASADNNTVYVVNKFKQSLASDGFEIIYAKANDDIGVSSESFTNSYYEVLGNKKFGFAYGTKGKDQGFIVAKKKKGSKYLYVCIYISGFDNTTLITLDVIEAEKITQNKKKTILSGFKGALVSFQKTTKWDSYIIPVSKLGYNSWENPLKVQGEITRTQYTTSKDNNPSFVYMNYLDAMKKANWEILFSGSGPDELGFDSYEWQYNMFQEGYKQGDQFGNKLGFRGSSASSGYAYIAAKMEDGDTSYYAVIYIVEQDDHTMINEDIIKAKTPKVGLVTAQLLTENIDKKGHLALEGIYFDLAKATLTDKSDKALKNIADYLNAHKDEKFFIVGHTDSDGDFSANLVLSKNRATAVMSALIDKYGVDANQLQAEGVANLAPIATNATTEGKAKNRRVEIVKR